MRIRPEAHVTRKYRVPDYAFNAPWECTPIYMMESLAKSIRFPTDLSSFSLSP